MSSASEGPAPASVSVVGEYLASPPTLTNGQTTPLLTDNKGNLSVNLQTALPAGTNILGKVGIDQTTPGTTNGVQVNAPLPAGTNIVGKFGIDQTTPGTTNGVQLTAGTAIAGKFGIDQTTPGTTNGVQVNAPLPAGTNTIGNVNTNLTTVKNDMDTALGDASVNTINGSSGAFLQVVASLSNACKRIFIAETTGNFIGVYTGASGFEVLAFIINPGMNLYRDFSIPANTRISLRSMNSASITTGQYIMEFCA